MNRPPRLVPEVPLPPYAFVPGTSLPHPISDPNGHSFGNAVGTTETLSPDSWQTRRPYLLGIDLFNNGYYWEAHEAWESLWRNSERRSTIAIYLQGLIKLAAAGVKALEGNLAGVQNHSRRAAELFRTVAPEAQGDNGVYMGVELRALIEATKTVAAHGVTDEHRPVFISIQRP